MEPKTIKEVYEFFNSKKVYTRFYGLDAAYTLNPYAYLSKRVRTMIPFTMVDSITLFGMKEIQITKIVYVAEDKNTIVPFQKELQKINGIEVFRVGHMSIDIVTKGNALLQYAKELNIDKSQIIAIGDSENAKAMIEVAGCGVAMENAEDELKVVANIITSTNNEAGVVKALKSLFDYSEDNKTYEGV